MILSLKKILSGLHNQERFLDGLAPIRQVGSTTALAQCIKRTGGYLIVRDHQEKRRVSKEYDLDQNRIFTIDEVGEGALRGLDPGPILVDPATVYKFGSEIFRLTNQLRRTIVKLRDLIF